MKYLGSRTKIIVGVTLIAILVMGVDSALGVTTISNTIISGVTAFISNAADPADAGVLRMGNAETICWEASPAATDVCVQVDSNENFVIDGGIVAQGGQRILSSSATPIGIQVTNSALTVGSLGTIALPVKTTAGVPTDAQGGNLDGSIVFNTADNTLHCRDGASWIVCGAVTRSHISWVCSVSACSEAGKTKFIRPYFDNSPLEKSTPAVGDEVIMPFSGTVKNLYVRLETAAGASQNHAFTIFRNGVATSIVATLTNTTTGSDTTNTVSVVAGDRIALRAVGSSGAAVSGQVSVSVEIV